MPARSDRAEDMLRSLPASRYSFIVRDVSGFTILEFIIVLFLLGGLLSLIIPRMSFGDNVTAVGRRWVGSLRSLQDMAMATQKTVRLYVDLDRGMYWPMVIDGSQEKPPIDANWALPLSLPDFVRITDVQVGGTKRESGRTELMFYPNGRIDPSIMHLVDGDNNVVGIVIEPVTATIRITDQRVEPQKPLIVSDRTKVLLQPLAPSLPTSLPPTLSGKK